MIMLDRGRHDSQTERRPIENKARAMNGAASTKKPTPMVSPGRSSASMPVAESTITAAQTAGGAAAGNYCTTSSDPVIDTRCDSSIQLPSGSRTMEMRAVVPSVTGASASRPPWASTCR
jgi:hypothetical protein